MTQSPPLTLHLRCARLSSGAGVIAMLAGALVLVGWLGRIELLKSALPGFEPMNPLTAFGFALAGLALLLQVRPLRSVDGPSTDVTRFAKVLSALVLALGLIELASQCFGVFTDAMRFGPDPHQMAFNTALDLVLIGIGLFALDVTTAANRRPAEPVAALAALISLLAMFGYAYRVQALYGLPGYTEMALNTAIVSFLLAMGVLCSRPNVGFMALVTSDGVAGLLLRWVFPTMVLTLFLLGWLRLEGERRGLFGPAAGVALYTIANIVIFGALAVWSAFALQRMSAQRERAVVVRDKALAFNRMIMDNSPDVICVIDRERRFVEVSAASTALWGYAPTELIGRSTVELVHPEDLAKSAEVALSIKSGKPLIDFSNRYLCKDGHVVVVDWSAVWSEANGLMFCVARDATQRKQAEEQLRLGEEKMRGLNATLASKAEELQQINRDLESFSYSVSHDLRAPLRHIHGYARMLKEDADDQLDGPMRRYLDAIAGSARQMGALIDDLLAFSRLGRKPLEFLSVDMTALAEHALREIGDDRTSPNKVHVAEPLPSAHADPVLMKQVWINLLSNALKYSAKRGDNAQVEVSGERDGEVTRYRVQDNGVGFDMRYVDKLFGVFQRLHTHEEFEGTGVGLAIVQRIVSRHGGKVWAEGQPDQGATFTFELPAADAQPVEDAA